jgi:hypothetical protein
VDGKGVAVITQKRAPKHQHQKNLTKKPKPKNKPTKLPKEIITKLTKLFSPIQITNEDN